MIKTRAAYQRIAQRAGLGGVVAIHHDRPGAGTVTAFVIVWLVFSGLTFINPSDIALLAIAPTILFAVIGLIIYTMLSGERLIVCQGGVLIGSVAPLLKPYPIRFEQIVVGSVVPISGNIRRFAKHTGLPVMPSVRTAWWSRRGVSLAGPSPAEARHNTALRERGEHAGRMGLPWLIGTRSSAEQATADIARAAGLAGFSELARATATAAPRALTGDPADNDVLLPGIFTPVGPEPRG